MASLRECHDSLAARLETISGLRVFNHPPQASTPPVAFMVLTEWEPTAMGRSGPKVYRFEVYVLTAEGGRPNDGYHALLEYADSSVGKSVEAAVWDGNVNGVFAGLASTFAQVSAFRVLGQTQVDELGMYGGVFTVEIQTRTS